MYLKAMTVGVVSTNCYLLGDEESKTAVVVDPGDRGKKIAQQLKLDGYTPVMVLLTHGHFDHVTGVKDLLAEAGSMPVYLSAKDYPTCPTGFGMTALDGLGELEEATFLSEGDTLPFADKAFQVIETPGHTPGGLTFAYDTLLFTGDTLFTGSCGRTDFANSDPQAMLDSLAKLAKLEGDYTVLPGHGPASTLERERRGNPYMRHALSR